MALAIDELTIRESGPADVPSLAAHLVEGLRGYQAFQPDGWTSPGVEQEAARIARRIADPASWKRVAFDGDELVGQVLLEPARDLPVTGHLASLFVSPAWWGTGLAAHLHELTVAEMRARGYVQGRLFTPEGQARARRFYERAGWRLEGEPAFDPELRMTLVQYRLAL